MFKKKVHEPNYEYIYSCYSQYSIIMFVLLYIPNNLFGMILKIHPKKLDRTRMGCLAD